MIILESKEDKIIQIPKTFSFNYDMYDLFIKSEVTNKEYVFKDNVNLSQSPLYYQFILDLSELEDKSEYRYTILKNNFILEEGLMRIGDYKDKKTSYDERTEYQEYRD